MIVTQMASKYGVQRSDFPDDRSYQSAYQRAFRKTRMGRAHVLRMNLRAKGITPEQYATLLQSQGNRCAVCGTGASGRNQHGEHRLTVDHDRACCPGDRSCGRCIRGLLCQNCNRAEGLLHGNAQQLAEYLNRKYVEFV